MADRSVSDNLTRLRSALTSTRFAAVDWVAETGSTNADLMGLVDDGVVPGSRVLIADAQHAGRGRLDRTWEAPAGSSLLLSVLLQPQLAPDQIHLAVHAVAIAAVDAVRVAGIDAGIKWPNDVVVETADGTRKLAGILAESKLSGSSVSAFVVGIGLNVNWPSPLPDELTSVAVAANQLLGHELDRVDLAADLLVNLDTDLALLDTGPGRATLLTRYRDRCLTIGHDVQVEMPGEVFEGRGVAIDDMGHLVVEVPGEVEARLVTAGDVIHVRRRP